MIVVAGVGNVLRRDDGFGPAVIERLASGLVPPGVRLVDAGVRTMQLAYELADDVELFVAVDAVARDERPGTLVVLEPDFAGADAELDAHGMDLHQVWTLAGRLGPGPRRSLLVGCVPEDLTDGIGLSPTVGATIEEAATLVLRHIEEAHRS